ncbi:hypothetical protein V6N12_065803 [Hibiscus sabdariffa]|uniref:Retrotransposon gag domain-containing protein n=1 Tax=Hibiscus sabdariffa TaxID=183260 RepID=A0ABR2G9S3_9ROSI
MMFNMLNTLGQFGGSPTENARHLLKSYLEIYNSFKIHVVSNDVLKLKLFPYSMRDKAKDWLNNLPPCSFQSWTELCRSFLAKFSYNNMIDNLCNEITSFRQEDDEAMHEAWEHYRDLFRCCPMHRLLEWTQVSIFYNSVNTPTRMMLDASANGTLLDKPPREGLEILEKLAQNDYQHPNTRRGTMRRGTAQLDSSDTILAQISTLTNMAKNLQKQPAIHEVKLMDSFCELCGNNHDSSECGQNPKTSYYNNTLSPSTSTQQGYQSQPRQNQQLNQPRQDYQQPNNYRTLENTLNTFMTQTSAYIARTDKFIQKTDAFMDRTEIRMQNQEAGAIHEQCKAISTRSGKVLKTPTENKQGETTVANSKAAEDTDNPAPTELSATTGKAHNSTSEPEEAEITTATPQTKQPRKDTPEEPRPPRPFPQRLKKQKQEY